MNSWQMTRAELCSMLLPFLEQGHSIAGLADALGVRHRRIQQALTQEGKDPKKYQEQRTHSLPPGSLDLSALWEDYKQKDPEYPKQQEKKEEIKALWGNGELSLSYISQTTGVSVKQIQRLAVKEGWALRKPHRGEQISEEKIVKLHKHISIKEIAERTKQDRVYISAVLRRHGQAPRAGHPGVLSLADRQGVEALYEQGKSVRQIADQFGVAPSVIGEIVFRLNDRKKRLQREDPAQAVDDKHPKLQS